MINASNPQRERWLPRQLGTHVIISFMLTACFVGSHHCFFPESQLEQYQVLSCFCFGNSSLSVLILWLMPLSRISGSRLKWQKDKEASRGLLRMLSRLWLLPQKLCGYLMGEVQCDGLKSEEILLNWRKGWGRRGTLGSGLSLRRWLVLPQRAATLEKAQAFSP